MTQKLKICGVRNQIMLDVCLKNNVEYLGINFVPSSRRCVGSNFFNALVKQFKTPQNKSQLVALFMNQSLSEIEDKVSSGIFNIVQLHGDETPEFCAQIKEKFSDIKIWKALKIQKNVETKHLSSEKNLPNPLEERELKGEIKNFAPHIDAFLFDGPKPGSGQTADFSALKKITDFCDSLNNKFELNDQIQDSSSNLNYSNHKEKTLSSNERVRHGVILKQNQPGLPTTPIIRGTKSTVNIAKQQETDTNIRSWRNGGGVTGVTNSAYHLVDGVRFPPSPPGHFFGVSNNKFELNDQIQDQDSSSNLNYQSKKIIYGIAGGINPDNIGLVRETFGGADFFDTASGVEVEGEFCEEKLLCF